MTRTVFRYKSDADMPVTFNELRAAIEAQGHDTNCDINDHWSDKPCNCGHAAVLTALTTLEHEHAERERRLREVQHSWSIGHYAIAEQQLAEILDSPSDTNTIAPGETNDNP